VRPLQQLLRARSENMAVDGIFGPNTEAAVKAFQQSKRLAVDGIVGPQPGLSWSCR
jgi:peptidoglycan hydrolase-like protein with peptidoglycan-binding domain